MNPSDPQPALKPLHADDTLIQSKLEAYGKLSTQDLIDSLKPGQPGSFKVRPDGTIVDGHHRIRILRNRGLDVDSLPREIVPKDPLPGPP
jgi:ParB-like chromosome segregation protein Spo0J